MLLPCHSEVGQVFVGDLFDYPHERGWDFANLLERSLPRLHLSLHHFGSDVQTVEVCGMQCCDCLGPAQPLYLVTFHKARSGVEKIDCAGETVLNLC